MNRAEHRALVRTYLDNRNTDNDARWTDTDINMHLNFAANKIVNQAVAGGLGQLFMRTQQTSVTTDGYAVLPQSIKIVNVFYSTGPGSLLIRVMPGQRGARSLMGITIGNQLIIDYIPRNLYPTDDITQVIWAQGAYANDSLDQIVCLEAAAALKLIDGQSNPALQEYLETLRVSVLSTPLSPNVKVMQYGNPAGQLGGYRSYWYQDTPTSIGIYLGMNS